MKIRITALDTLFFRDAKPFNMSEDSWATGIFPPPPSVFYGVLRSAYLSQKGYSKANIAASAHLKIHQIFIGLQEEIRLWTPYDLVISNKGNRTEKKHLLQIVPYKSISNFPKNLTYYLIPPENEAGFRLKIDGIGGEALMIEDSIEDYLNNKPPIYESIRQFITAEPKVGIGRNNITRVAAESALYRVGMQRLKNEMGKTLNFVVEFSGFDLEEKGVLKMGGEGKAVSYQEEKDLNLDFEKVDISAGFFKIYLATPAIFTKGWLPDWIDEQTMIGTYGDLKIKLLTVALGKSLSIGGFDIDKRQPKTMYKAVPQGSVYYFQLLEGTSEDVFRAFHQQSISDKKAKEGFGCSLVGTFKISDL